MKYSMISFLFLVLSVVLGCGSGPDQMARLSIYGGKKSAAGSWPGAVAITTNGYIYCSGIAVHPRMVLTAAHCINGVNRVSSTKIYLGEGHPSRQVSPNYSVVEGWRSPGYSGKNYSGNDIAFLVTAADLPIAPENIIPILHRRDDVEGFLLAGSKTTLVGFGKRDDGGIGEKYEVDTEIVQVGSKEVVIGGEGKDSCRIDSGGPAYLQLDNGAWRVFGVVSRGIEKGCGKGGIWGLIHAHACWIEKSSGIDLGLEPGTCES